MNSRFKSFPFGRNKNKTSSPAANSVVVPPSNGTSPTSHTSPPSNHSNRSSSTSLSVNNSQAPAQQQLGRPPSYSPNRPTSPMSHNPQHTLVQHPAPINPNMHYAQPGVQQPLNAPPGYGMPQQHMPHGVPPGMSRPQYAGRNPAEAEGVNRNRAQLIVGIDFGTTFSGVAFAFATNNEAREDIITEWPGAGTHTKQKVSAWRH